MPRLAASLSERRDVVDRDRAGYHLVPEAGHDGGDAIKSLRALVCDQNPEMFAYQDAAQLHDRPMSEGLGRAYRRVTLMQRSVLGGFFALSG